MNKVVSLDEKRREKMGVVPTYVKISSPDASRMIIKELTIPFIPQEGMTFFFSATIKGEKKSQLATVKYCSYAVESGELSVWLKAEDSVLDNLLESGGFNVFRY